MIRKFLISVENWMDDQSVILSMLKFFFILIIGIFLVTFPIYFAFGRGVSEEDKCLEAGNAWMITGHHQGTRMVLVGKALMAQPYTVTDYGCLKVER